MIIHNKGELLVKVFDQDKIDKLVVAADETVLIFAKPVVIGQLILIGERVNIIPYDSLRINYLAGDTIRILSTGKPVGVSFAGINIKKAFVRNFKAFEYVTIEDSFISAASFEANGKIKNTALDILVSAYSVNIEGRVVTGSISTNNILLNPEAQLSIISTGKCDMVHYLQLNDKNV